MPKPVIDIIVPTLGRPARILDVAANLSVVTPAEAYRLLFVCDHDDDDSIEAVGIAARVVQADLTICDGTYPRKINHGVAQSLAQIVCLAGDDAVWHPRWDVAARAAMTPDVSVVGTRDLTPSSESGHHSTQPIVRRSYLMELGGSLGEPGRAYHEGYHHNFCETELCSLAHVRGVWRFAPDSVIEHRHPDWGTAELDATYEKGARQHWDRDAALFAQRSAEWSR